MTKTVEVDGVVYSNPAHVRFIHDMQKAGFDVEFYHGRSYWYGPMVRTDERNGPTLQEALSATKVRCQRDNCAFDWIVYPVIGDSSLGGQS